MKTYTVVGIYLDDYTRFADSFEADSPEEAELVAHEHVDDQSFVVAGVFEGELEAVA